MFADEGNRYESKIKTIADAESPNIFASKLKGRLKDAIIKVMVVPPPINMAQKAATVLLRFQ